MADQDFKTRFRSFLPVVIDVETGGFNPAKDALLEVAAVFLDISPQGILSVSDDYYHAHLVPFKGANIEKSAIEFLGLDIEHPFRLAKDEKEAIREFTDTVDNACKQHECTRAVLVGHNPMFDLSFLQAAFTRSKIKNPPLHKFTTFDTATLSALAYGQTVLAKALYGAGIEFDEQFAHGALYDAQKTAELFCTIFNNWQLQD